MDCVLVNAIDKKGYVWSFTLRADDLMDLFEKIKACTEMFVSLDFKPSTRSSVGSGTKPTAKPTESKKCEEHDIVMEQKVSKTSGKPYFAHFDQEEGICFGTGYKGKSY